jgi:hypothetical protein
MIPTTNPVLVRMALEAVRNRLADSFKTIGKEFGIGEKCLRKYAKAAGIHRKRGAKSWRIRVHPRDWTPLQRRIAHTAGVIAEGQDKERRDAEAQAVSRG